MKIREIRVSLPRTAGTAVPTLTQVWTAVVNALQMNAWPSGGGARIVPPMLDSLTKQLTDGGSLSAEQVRDAIGGLTDEALSLIHI